MTALEELAAMLFDAHYKSARQAIATDVAQLQDATEKLLHGAARHTPPPDQFVDPNAMTVASADETIAAFHATEKEHAEVYHKLADQ